MQESFFSSLRTNKCFLMVNGRHCHQLRDNIVPRCMCCQLKDILFNIVASIVYGFNRGRAIFAPAGSWTRWKLPLPSAYTIVSPFDGTITRRAAVLEVERSLYPYQRRIWVYRGSSYPLCRRLLENLYDESTALYAGTGVRALQIQLCTTQIYLHVSYN